MTNFDHIRAEKIQKKLKNKKVRKLVKEVFGKSIDVNCFGSVINVKERQRGLAQFFDYDVPATFLTLFSCDNYFVLREEKYLDKTKEFAEKYKESFGGETTIKPNYSLRK